MTIMEAQGNTTANNRPAGRKAGILIALIALVAVISGGAFAYNALAQSQEATKATQENAPNGAVANGDMQNNSNSTSSQQESIYLKDRNSTVYTEQDIPLLLTEIADCKPLVMNFWATWCPYCVQEMDDFQKIYDEYGDRVSFAFIDCVDGRRETVEDGASWLRNKGYTLPAYYDTDFDAVRDYRAANLPTTVVAGADGEILAISVGAINPDKMRAALDALLAA